MEDVAQKAFTVEAEKAEQQLGRENQ